MGKRGEIFSSRLQKERRTYFFNVHESFRQALSLSIVESKTTDTEGIYTRQSVLVFEEDLDDFLRELQKSIDVIRKVQLKKNNKQEHTND